MSIVELTAKQIVSVDPRDSGRITFAADMSDSQIFVAIDLLLDAGGPQKRAERLAQLLENELTGAHA